MSQLNIKHPKTGMWRCFSTNSNTWVSDWLSEKDYEEWLISDTVRTLRNKLDRYGIPGAEHYIFNDAVYMDAQTKYEEEHCTACEHHDCDNCWLYEGVDDYIEMLNTPDFGDPLGIKDILIKGDD